MLLLVRQGFVDVNRMSGVAPLGKGVSAPIAHLEDFGADRRIVLLEHEPVQGGVGDVVRADLQGVAQALHRDEFLVLDVEFD